ncbi:MAG: biotin/lipoyl-binding protein, partial [Actinobacteria bacterium]|nr:biotin/lipoyl-binding protein [Actinomycetota bacterium]
MATLDVKSPLIGTVFRITVAAGDQVRGGEEILIVESMKMEHPVEAPADGTVESILVAEGDTIAAGQVLVRITPGTVSANSAGSQTGATGPSDAERADLARYRERRFLTTDEARPDAVARRAAKGHRTARANIADLVDDGSFVEYGSFAIAAQRRRRELDDLIRNTPADGLVGGLATVNASVFPGDASRVAVASYDY